MKLMYSKLPGETPARVDVCGLDVGHEGEHEGRWAGMKVRETQHGPSVDTHGRRISYLEPGQEPDPGIGQRAG